jgi:hypothetical protein
VRDGDPKAAFRHTLGRGYNPEKFELEKVNKKLAVIGRKFERAKAAALR